MKNSDIYTGMRFVNEYEEGVFTRAEFKDPEHMWIEWVFDTSPSETRGVGTTYRRDGVSTSREIPHVIEEEEDLLAVLQN